MRKKGQIWTSVPPPQGSAPSLLGRSCGCSPLDSGKTHWAAPAREDGKTPSTVQVGREEGVQSCLGHQKPRVLLVGLHKLPSYPRGCRLREASVN